MTVQWQKVHVFISSTFNDMHAERDYLVKRVFPELQPTATPLLERDAPNYCLVFAAPSGRVE